MFYPSVGCVQEILSYADIYPPALLIRKLPAAAPYTGKGEYDINTLNNTLNISCLPHISRPCLCAAVKELKVAPISNRNNKAMACAEEPLYQATPYKTGSSCD